MITIENEPPGVEARIEALLDRTFGPGRLRKTVQRLRDGRLPADGLAFVARDGAVLVGTIRLWNVCIGGRWHALLLGPVAVDTPWHDNGVGATLIRHSLRAALARRHRAVILVGDEPYYRRFGFRAEGLDDVTLPGPVDRRRFLGLELVRRGLAGVRGPVEATGRRTVSLYQPRDCLRAA
jgi:predicted N-acetyltransferase YhbS